MSTILSIALLGVMASNVIRRSLTIGDINRKLSGIVDMTKCDGD